jgi:hypothetical protein
MQAGPQPRRSDGGKGINHTRHVRDEYEYHKRNQFLTEKSNQSNNDTDPEYL